MKNITFIWLYLLFCNLSNQILPINTALDLFKSISVKKAEQQKKLKKKLRQELILYQQDLCATNKSIDAIKSKIYSSENEKKTKLSQEIYQTLCKIRSVLEESLDFIKKIILLHDSSFSISGLSRAVNNSKLIKNKKKRIDQLNLKGNKNQDNLSLSTQRENNESILVGQLKNFKKKLDRLSLKRDKYHKYLVKLKTKEGSSLKKEERTQTNLPIKRSRFTHLPYSITKKPLFLIPLIGLMGYGMQTKNNEENPSNQTQKTISQVNNTDKQTENKIKEKKKEPQEEKRREEKKKIEEKQQKQTIQQKKIIPPKDGNFIQFYGEALPELAEICRKLKSNQANNKPVSIPEGLFLISPEEDREFEIKCLTEEINASLYSIPSNFLLVEILKDEDFLKKIIINDRKQNSLEKPLIIDIGQINLPSNLPPNRAIEILNSLSRAIKKTKHINKNGTPVITIGFLDNSFPDLYKKFIQSVQFKIINIPLPSKKLRENIINKNLLGKYPNSAITSYLIERTKGMSIASLQDIIQELMQSSKKKKGKNFTNQDIREIIGKKKSKQRNTLLKAAMTDYCSWPQVGLEDYFGKIPKPFQYFSKTIEKNGFDNPTLKTMLLTGYQGAGKRYLASCIAGHFGAPFIKVPLEALDSSKEKDLNRFVLEAQKIAKKDQAKMVVLYVENIDSFINQFSDKENKILLRRIKKWFENIQIDTSKNLPHVLLIGSAQHIYISPQLKDLIGPKVFERSINLPFPDNHHIKKLLKKFGKYDVKINLDEFAKKLVGYHPGIINKLIHEAKIIAEDDGRNNISQEDIFLAGRNFLALDFFHKSVQDNVVDFNTLEGFAGTIPKEIVEYGNIICNRIYFTNYNVPVPSGILMTGPPGTGKTLLAKKLAEKHNCPIKIVSGADFMKKYVGEGAEKLGEYFGKLREIASNPMNKNKLAVIGFVDEAEPFIQTSNSNTNQLQGTGAVRAKFLEEMNNIKLHNQNKDLPPITIIAATNIEPSKLDEACKRPGRFDKIINMELPRDDDQKKILDLYLQNRPVTEDIDLNMLIKKTKGFSGADLENAVHEAAYLAAINKSKLNQKFMLNGIKEALKKKKNREKKKTNYR